MDVNIDSGSSLFLLPDPVTCFRSARYNQLQTFRAAADASVVLLDWISSGRKALGEDWSFSRYYSLNELWVDGKRVARDLSIAIFICVAEPRPRATGAQIGPKACKIHSSLKSEPKLMKSSPKFREKDLVS